MDDRCPTYETVSWLELAQSLGGVVDQSESARLATTELGPQAEDSDLLG